MLAFDLSSVYITLSLSFTGSILEEASLSSKDLTVLQKSLLEFASLNLVSQYFDSADLRSLVQWFLTFLCFGAFRCSLCFNE